MTESPPAAASRSRYADGARAAIPLAAAAVLLGISFGVIAKPVMGSVAPIVMSAIVFAGAAQFAAVSVLADGGSAAAAIAAGDPAERALHPDGRRDRAVASRAARCCARSPASRSSTPRGRSRTAAAAGSTSTC